MLFRSVFSQSWQTYPYSPVGTVLSFPLDDGKHTSTTTNTEWWYINMHVIGSAPAYKVYDVMLCYFSKPATMRIFNIACPTTGTFHTNVNQTPLALTQQTGHWELTYTIPPLIADTSKWTYLTDYVPYRYYFHATNPTDNDALNITVTSNRIPLNVGNDGFVPIGTKGDSSFYYSYSNMKVKGTIKFSGVTDTISSGIAWIDRQWGPFTVGTNANNLYEWYSMQLDKPGVKWGTPQSPSEYNIWQIYSDTSSIPYAPESRLVTGIYPDNSQDTSSSYIYERTSYWHDQANNKYYSSSWRMINPLRNLNLDMVPTIPNQVINVTLFKFWEGATTIKGVVENQDVEGTGFAELVAGHNYPINTPSVPAGLAYMQYADHNKISWNASTPGTYPIGGYRVFRSKSNNGYWKYIATTSNLSYDDYSANKDSMYYYTVTSFDNQTSTSASGYASPVLLGVKDISAINNSVNVYPNPAKNQVTVDFYAFAAENNPVVELLSIDGKLLSSQRILKSKTQIDVSDLSSGLYILKISGNNGVVVKKFAKE